MRRKPSQRVGLSIALVPPSEILPRRVACCFHAAQRLFSRFHACIARTEAAIRDALLADEKNHGRLRHEGSTASHPQRTNPRLLFVALPASAVQTTIMYLRIPTARSAKEITR